MTSGEAPVTPAVAASVVKRLTEHMPADWRLIVVGGVALASLTGQPGATTKDLDVICIMGTGEKRIPDAVTLAASVRQVAEDVEVRKDQDVVTAHVKVPEGVVRVELLRGRGRGKGGYFVTRPILEKVAHLSTGPGKVLQPPPEALAFLKAWAASDKAKLVASGRDATGYHERRRRSFEADVRRIFDTMAREGGRPDGRVLQQLLDLAPATRRPYLVDLLRRSGAPL